MGQLYVYEPWPTAVDTMGLCGPLTPTKATCTQEKNGDFRLDIEHPIDAAGKWASLVPGNLVKADVPLSTSPLVQGDGSMMTSISRANIQSVSLADRAIKTAPGSGIRMATLAVGAEIYVIGTSGAYSRVIWPGGNGYIPSASLGTLTGVTLASPWAEAIEQYVPSPRSRMQLFRIQSASMTDSGVKIGAQHVFYDELGNITTNTITPTSARSALTNAAANRLDSRVETNANPFWRCNIITTKDVAGWTRVSPVEVIMSPSSGIGSYWTAFVMRDNWTTTVLKSAGINRGYRIEYARNLKGITYATDYAEIIAQILPVGQTSKGKPLTVPTGTYTVDGASVSVTSGLVSSPIGDTYPVPHIAVLDMGSEIKATGTDSTALNAAYVKLIRAALAKFADEQCDFPQVTLNVDFLHLGDTAEYAQYRDLQKLFLYDTVRVKHPRLGIDVTAQVNKTVWDCMLDMYVSVELGSVRKNYARTRFASWQVPGLETLSAYVDTISSAI